MWLFWWLCTNLYVQLIRYHYLLTIITTILFNIAQGHTSAKELFFANYMLIIAESARWEIFLGSPAHRDTFSWKQHFLCRPRHLEIISFVKEIKCFMCILMVNAIHWYSLWKALLTAQVIPIITPWGYGWLISPRETCLGPSISLKWQLHYSEIINTHSLSSQSPVPLPTLTLVVQKIIWSFAFEQIFARLTQKSRWNKKHTLIQTWIIIGLLDEQFHR